MQPAASQAESWKKDLNLLEAIIKEYEAKLNQEIAVRDGVMSKLPIARDASAQAELQQQLNYSNKRVELLSTELLKYMTQQSEIREKLGRVASSRRTTVAPSAASSETSDRSRTRSTRPIDRVSTDTPPPRKSSVTSIRNNLSVMAVERVRTRELDELRAKASVIAQQRQTQDPNARTIKQDVIRVRRPSQPSTATESTVISTSSPPPNELEELRNKVALHTQQKQESDDRTKRLVPSTRGSRVVEHQRQMHLRQQQSPSPPLQQQSPRKIDSVASKILDIPQSLQSNAHTKLAPNTFTAYLKWSNLHQAIFVDIHVIVERELPSQEWESDTQYNESLSNLESKLMDVEYEVADCIRSIGGLRRMLQHRQQQQERYHQYREMMCILIQMLVTCGMQKNSLGPLDSTIAMSTQAPNVQQIAQFIETSSSAAEEAANEGRYHALSSVRESAAIKSMERSHAAQIQQEKFINTELQKELAEVQQKLKNATNNHQQLLRQQSDQNAIKNRLAELEAAKKISDEQSIAMSTEVQKRNTELSQLRKEHNIVKSQMLNLDQEIGKERNAHRDLMTSHAQINEQKDVTIFDLHASLYSTQQKLVDMTQAKQDVQDNFTAIQSRIIYLEAKERELMTLVKRQAAKYEHEHNEVTIGLEQARSLETIQNTNSSKSLSKEECVEIAQLSADKAHLTKKLAKMQKSIENQKHDYEMTLNELQQQISELAEHNKDMEHQRDQGSNHSTELDSSVPQEKDKTLNDLQQLLDDVLSERTVAPVDNYSAKQQPKSLHNEKQNVSVELSQHNETWEQPETNMFSEFDNDYYQNGVDGSLANSLRSPLPNTNENNADKIRSMELAYTSLEEHTVQLQERNDEAAIELKELRKKQNEMQDMMQEFTSLTKRLTETEQELEEAKQTAIVEVQSREELESLISHYKEELMNAQDTLDEHERCIDRIEELSLDLRQAREECERCEKLLQQNKNQLNLELDTQLSSTTALIKQLEQEKQAFSDELDNMRDKAQATDVHVEDLEHQISDATQRVITEASELDIALRKCHTLEQALEIEQDQSRELTETLWQNQQDFDKEMEDMGEKMQNLQSQMIDQPTTDANALADLVNELDKGRELLRIKDLELGELEREISMLRSIPANNEFEVDHDDENNPEDERHIDDEDTDEENSISEEKRIDGERDIDEERSTNGETSTDNTKSKNSERTIHDEREDESNKGSDDLDVSSRTMETNEDYGTLSNISELENELKLRRAELDAALSSNKDLSFELERAQDNLGILEGREQLIQTLQATIVEMQRELVELQTSSYANIVTEEACAHELEMAHVETEKLRSKLAGMVDYDYKHERLIKIESILTEHQLSFEEDQQRRLSRRHSVHRSHVKSGKGRLSLSEDDNVVMPSLDKDLHNQAYETNTADTVDDSDADTELIQEEFDEDSRFDLNDMSHNPMPPLPPAELLSDYLRLQQTCKQLEDRLATSVDYEHNHVRVEMLEEEASQMRQQLVRMNELEQQLAAVADYDYKHGLLAQYQAKAIKGDDNREAHVDVNQTQISSVDSSALQSQASILEDQLAVIDDYEDLYQTSIKSSEKTSISRDGTEDANVVEDSPVALIGYDDERQAPLSPTKWQTIDAEVSYNASIVETLQQELSTLSVHYEQALISLAGCADYEYKHTYLIHELQKDHFAESSPLIGVHPEPSDYEQLEQMQESIAELARVKCTLQMELSEAHEQLHDTSKRQATQTAELMSGLSTIQSLYSQSKMQNAELIDHIENIEANLASTTLQPDERKAFEEKIISLQTELDTVLEKNMMLAMQLSVS